MNKITNENIETIYNELKSKWEITLKDKGVKLSSLYRGGKVNGTAYSLCLLSINRDKFIHQDEINDSFKEFIKESKRDTQVRHLRTQSGWDLEFDNKGGYKLNSFNPWENFIPERRNIEFSEDWWNELKDMFDCRCATCGSKEGEKSFKKKAGIVKLEKGHMDPRLPLNETNTIPQCNYCNGIYQSKFIFDQDGNIKKQINFR